MWFSAASAECTGSKFFICWSQQFEPARIMSSERQFLINDCDELGLGKGKLSNVE